MTYLDDWEDHREERQAQRIRQLGCRSPMCSRPGCAETDPLALTGSAPNIVCYECRAGGVGRTAIEVHHVAGRANAERDVVALPGNDHRALSDAQYGWPRETLRNPDASPLLRAAASIRGWLDVLLHIVAQTVGWVPPFLEWLDAALRTAIGPRWWTDLGWEN